MNDLFKFALSSQTIYGGIQFLLFTISLGAVIGALQHYHANDRVTFNCYPKPGDFTKQVCYDKYISTVSPWLIPRNIAGITYAVVFACWICFMLYAAVTLRQIKREQAEQNRRRRQLRKFLQMYCLHVGFRLVFLGAMIGLFCSYQTLNLPSVFKCDPPVPQTNTTSTPVYQTETGLQCNDLHYKEKSNLNIAIIVIKSSILMLGILEVIHLSLARDTFQKKLVGDMQIDMEDLHRVSESDVEPMLNRSQATNENTVNKTDSKAHKQGRRRRRLKKKEEEKKKRIRRKNAERGPPAALHDAQEREQKEIKEGLLQLRHELKNYDFQKCPRIKKEAFQDLDVHDIYLVRIAVIGPTGSGKTSLISTLQRALEEPQTAMVEWNSMVGREGTIILEEHYVQKKIRLIDTRGFLVGYVQLEDELLKIVSGRIRPGDDIVRNYDKKGNQEPTTTARIAPALSEYAHAVIFVVKRDDPCLMNGKYKDTLQKIRETFCQEGYVPVTVITCTFLDKLNKEDKDATFQMVSKATGSSRPTTFFITNHNTYEHDKAPFEVDRTALDILNFALLSAERFIKIRKQRERNQLEREVIAGVPSSVETVDRFFSRVEKKYKWTDQERTKAVREKLRKMEINNVDVFKEIWNDIKSELPLTGMKIDLEEEMKHI